MQSKSKIFRLKGAIQEYAWGGKEFLPKLLGMDNHSGVPFAEYWLGAHKNSPALLISDTGSQIPLDSFIDAAPKEILGETVYKEFGRLPYLLKVLDVADMLSIQVHPQKSDAQKAFEEENRRNIPLNAANRNYKDNNHKPEITYALSEFWLLHGFRSAASIQKMLENKKELQFLAKIFGEQDYESLYRSVMEMTQEEVDKRLQPLLNRILPDYDAGKLSKDDPDFWAARAAITFEGESHIDRGIFSIYLLNLVHLHPGQAIFQDAGILHAYLEGENIELMANSDNVLRGGLTIKHIDVPELLRHVVFKPIEPKILEGKPSGIAGEIIFSTRIRDFQLSRINLRKDDLSSVHTTTTDIFFVLDGVLDAESGKDQIALKKGVAFAAIADTDLVLKAKQETSIFRATVPVTKG